MPMILSLDGALSESEFHDAVTYASGIAWYGRNLDALDELLAELVEPPITIEWKNAAASRETMGDRFDAIVGVLRDAQRELGPEKFLLKLQ